MHKHQHSFEIVIEIDAHKNGLKREQNWLKMEIILVTKSTRTEKVLESVFFLLLEMKISSP